MTGWKLMWMIATLFACLMVGDCNALSGTYRRALQQGRGGSSAGGSNQLSAETRAINTLRGGQATGAAIQRSTNSAGSLGTAKNAAAVGSKAVFTNAQNGFALSDVADSSASGGKKLLQNNGGGAGGANQLSAENRAINTLRGGQATGAAIQRSTNSAASLGTVKRAANVGSSVVFANAQNGGALSDVADSGVGGGKKLLQNNGGGAGGANQLSAETRAINTLRGGQATGAAIQRSTNSAGSLGTAKNAAAVGSKTVFANAQNGFALSDVADNGARGGKK